MQKLDKKDVEQRQAIERLAAENAQLRADLDYMQIMTGVTIPTAEEDINERMV